MRLVLASVLLLAACSQQGTEGVSRRAAMTPADADPAAFAVANNRPVAYCITPTPPIPT